MPRFLIHETQSIVVLREFEAENEDAAWQLYQNGEPGTSVGNDGDVYDTQLQSITEVEAGQ